MAKLPRAISPWGTSSRKVEAQPLSQLIEEEKLWPVMNAVSEAEKELETAAGMLQIQARRSPEVQPINYLFADALRILKHIKTDLEDARAGNPVTEKIVFSQIRG